MILSSAPNTTEGKTEDVCTFSAAECISPHKVLSDDGPGSHRRTLAASSRDLGLALTGAYRFFPTEILPSDGMFGRLVC